MKGIALIAAAGLLCAAIFLTWRSGAGGEDEALRVLSAQVDALALRWATEGPSRETRVLTFVLCDPYAGSDPLELPAPSRRRGLIARWFSEPGAEAFSGAFTGEQDFLAWTMSTVPSRDDPRPIAPFARILASARASGARLRVIAHGRAAALAIDAAAAAAREEPASPGPVLERLVGVGINSAALRAGHPETLARLEEFGGRAVGEWDNLWSDPAAVPRTLSFESWFPGARPTASERPEASAAWPAVVLGVWRSGAKALPPAPPQPPPAAEAAAAMRQFRNLQGEVFQKPAAKGGLELLQQAEHGARPAAPPEPSNDDHPIGDTGWYMRRLPDFQMITGHLNAAFWSLGPHRIDVGYGNNPNEPGARARCAQAGRKPAKAEHHGVPVEICNQLFFREVDKPLAHHDYLTILGKGYQITAVYTYDRKELRDAELKRFMNAVDALYPKR